jgi:hypothetical protein
MNYLKIHKGYIKDRLEFSLKVIFVFCIIYDIQTVQLGGITSARIASFLILSYIILFKGFSIDRQLLKFIGLCFLLICVSVVQALYSGDSTQVARLSYFTVYSILISYYFSKFISNQLELYWIFLVACSIQSIILLVSFFNISFKATLASYIAYGGNFEAEKNIYRAFGLSSTTGAALSLIQSIGVITSILIIKTYDVNKKKVVAFIIGFICFCSTLFVGRTGVVVSMFMYMLLLFSSKAVNILKYLPLSGIVLFVMYEVLSIESFFEGIDNFSTEYFFNWVSNAFSIQENRTVDALDDMKIPPVTYETIVGTGQIIASNGSNASGHDSGYIHAYYSLGLFFSFIFYISLFLYTIKLWDRKSFFVLVLVLIMFLVEYKEPFIFKYAFPFYLLTILNFQNRRMTL